MDRVSICVFKLVWVCSGTPNLIKTEVLNWMMVDRTPRRSSQSAVSTVSPEPPVEIWCGFEATPELLVTCVWNRTVSQVDTPRITRCLQTCGKEHVRRSGSSAPTAVCARWILNSKSVHSCSFVAGLFLHLLNQREDLSPPHTPSVSWVDVCVCICDLCSILNGLCVWLCTGAVPEDPAAPLVSVPGPVLWRLSAQR